MSYTSPVFTNSDEVYATLIPMADALLEDETDWISATANLSALIYDLLPDLNWAGFYRVKNDVLILGPFQGKPACNRIAKGKGVCGTCWLTDAPQVVPNVHLFPEHIACDSASNSEIVIPIHNVKGEFCALLDIDSPVVGRFSDEDLNGLLPVMESFERWLADYGLPFLE
jgi:GAF domain-containing protein